MLLNFVEMRASSNFILLGGLLLFLFECMVALEDGAAMGRVDG